MRYLLLALLLLFSSAFAEEIDKSEGEITNILVTIYFFDTSAEMYKYLEEVLEETDTERLEGYSLIERYTDRDLCHMDLYAVRPNRWLNEKLRQKGGRTKHYHMIFKHPRSYRRTVLKWGGFAVAFVAATTISMGMAAAQSGKYALNGEGRFRK